MSSMIVIVEGNESIEPIYDEVIEVRTVVPVEITLRRMQPPIKGTIITHDRDRQ